MNDFNDLLKERGNDHFLVKTPTTENFKFLVERGYVKEVNNILFLYNQYTKMWCVYNSDFTFIVVDDYPRVKSLWEPYVLKTSIFGNKKFSKKWQRFFFELTEQEVFKVIQFAIDNNYSYKDLYLFLKETLNLKEYELKD